MDNGLRVDRLLGSMQPTTRRQFLKRAAIMGATVPAFGSLLAACGGDDPTATPAPAPAATATPAAPGQDPTATADAAPEATATPGSAPTAPAATEPAGQTPEPAPEATATPAAPAEGEPRMGGIFRALGHHEISSLSPDDWGPAVHYFIVGNVHDRVLKLDDWFNLNPSVAESFDISDDGITYTFNIRQGMKFHDGEDVTAEDVKYTWDFRRDPANAAVSANEFSGIESIELLDEYTMVVTMDGPNAAILTRAGQAGIVAEHHHSAIGEDAYKADPIGSGPFKVVEWRAAEYTECVAHEDYWEGRPYLDGIREDIVPEASVRNVALRTGEAHSTVWPLVTEDHLYFRDQTDYTVQVTSSLAINHFPLNNQHPVLSDKSVRQAMMFAINRERIRDDLWQGLAVLATSNLSSALAFYYEPNVKQYPHDPAEATALLDAAGWEPGNDGIRVKDGQRCSFVCTVITGDQARRPEAEVVQQDLLDVGIEMTIEEAPVATIQEGQREGTIDASLYNWTYGGGSGEPDASTTLRSDARNNWNKFVNPRVDELLDMGLTETDPEARREIYSEIQQIVAEEVPFLFIKFWDWFNIFHPSVKGLPEDPLVGGNQYQFLHKMWLEEA